MRLGIDTGGTYTDAVLFDQEEGVVRTAKSLTTHYDLSVGIRDVIGRIDSVADEPLSQLVQFTSISTTLATNAIVEGHGGTICLLLIGENSNALKNLALKTALRNDPLEVIRGGHNAFGDEAQPLDVEHAKKSILHHADRVTAFAVAGIFSVRNTRHEVAIRDLILELTDKPVTCSFELTSKLDAPRRALTTVLNARLIQPISELISATRTELTSREIKSPLMVVKGDGSMISADIAATRPVETILSGPAASAVGAAYLSRRPLSVVSDVGGTTTDIALVHDGAPHVVRDGALVGGFRTFVEAVNVFTVGIGGDSQVSFDKPVTVGPERALPLCSLAKKWGGVIDVLENQLEQTAKEYQGCFALQRRSSADTSNFSKSERELWAMLENGPIVCEELYKDLRRFRALMRLRRLDLVDLAAFTPTDALHVLGKIDVWPSEASELGAKLWTRGFYPKGKPRWDSHIAFCNNVMEAVVRQSSKALVRAALVEHDAKAAVADFDQILLDKGIDDRKDGVLNVHFSFDKTMAAVGAPADSFYPEIAKRLNTPLEIPEHFEVGNAVGAVAGGVKQIVTGIITSPSEGVYRAHLPSGAMDFKDLEQAAEMTKKELEELARKRARNSSAADFEIFADRRDNIVHVLGNFKVFIESRISVTASAKSLAEE